jgi:hypothetical protein
MFLFFPLEIDFCGIHSISLTLVVYFAINQRITLLMA